ncbi:hypothetical protein JCM8097_004802 [Rhodosporidiobolus ruineniae]
MPPTLVQLVARAADSASASAASSTASSSTANPSSYKAIGVILAVVSGLLIGSSFVFKKKGLLASTKKAGNVAGEGHPYLKSPMWWTGMIIMILGEICNLVAYSFADAILVTPMGSVAVVVSGVLSHFCLKEKLTTFGWIGSALCILGSVILALNGPSSHESSDIESFMHLFIAPGFLAWLALSVAASAGMIFFVAPKYGKTHMLVYIGICSLLGGLSVACTSGLGSSILLAIRGDSSQWKHWFLYFLLAFCVVTLLLEINYLNKALELFNTSMVTPVYFTIFTTCTLVTSIILHKGFQGSTVSEIITVVLGFLVIVFGISILQLSKIDPVELKEGVLDRRSTVLLAASRAETSAHHGVDQEKMDWEDPGVDTIRGAAGAIGSIRRAISMRRSMSTMSRGGSAGGFGEDEMQMRRRGRSGAPGAGGSGELEMGMRAQPSVRRYQLVDEPMPLDAADKISLHSSIASPTPEHGTRTRASTLQFADTDQVHRYSNRPGTGQSAQHLEQPRLAGQHTHRDITSPGAASSNFPTSPLSAGGFSAARSGSLFSSSRYQDPYAEGGGSDAGDYGGDGATQYAPDSPKAHTLPRRRDTGGSGGDGRPTLLDRLGSAFGASSPQLASHDFAPNAEEAERSATAPTSATRHRFMIPSLSAGSRDSSQHRVPHPKGPSDLEAQESEALVSEKEPRGSTSSDDEDENRLRRMETYDSTTAL